MSNIADRLQAFKARFAKLGRAGGGGGGGGYEDVSALEAPLVGGGASDGFLHHEGPTAAAYGGGGGGYARPPISTTTTGSALYRPTAEVAAPEAGVATVHLPSQVGPREEGGREGERRARGKGKQNRARRHRGPRTHPHATLIIQAGRGGSV
jgi:hypothetical protein